jgi:hypothetical protein
VSSYYYICVRILLSTCPHTTISFLILLHACPHSTIYVSSYYYMCPHTTIYVFHTSIYVSSYYYIFVLIRLRMCPHTARLVPLLTTRTLFFCLFFFVLWFRLAPPLLTTRMPISLLSVANSCAQVSGFSYLYLVVI